MTDFGYCTDCETETLIGPDGRGSCGHGRVIRLPDPLTRSQADAMVAAAEAAALEKAACIVGPKRKNPVEKGNWFHGYTKDKGSVASIQVRKQLADNIRALITDDAQTALTKILAEERAEGARKATNAVWEEYQDSVLNKWTFRKEHVENAISRAMVSIKDTPTDG